MTCTARPHVDWDQPRLGLTPVLRYASNHLQTGDQCMHEGQLHDVLTGDLHTGHVVLRQASRQQPATVLVPTSMLRGLSYVQPGPGRISGLRAPFWLPPAARSSIDVQVFDPELALPGTAIALTLGGGLLLRGHADARTTLSLQVPGTLIDLGKCVNTPKRADAMRENLAVAARLDGGLSRAGKLLSTWCRPGQEAFDDLWTRAVQTHLGLEPYPACATPAHAIVAALAPGWDQPIEQLANVLAHLDPNSGAHH